MARFIQVYTHISHFGGSNESKRNVANGNHNQSRAALSAALLALMLISPCLSWGQQDRPGVPECTTSGEISTALFRTVMQTVAEAWNRGDARLAASCFAEDAIYSGPPSPSHGGRKALYEYFGGATGRDLAMRMAWHNLIFDPAQQIGVGEYTFRYRKQTHGLVIIKFANGLIHNWREYEVESELPWDQFIGENRF
jgi:hypothetical protein